MLEGRRRVLGPEHPAVARTLYNLGVAADAAGDREAARRSFEEAFAVASAAEAVDVATFAQAQLAELSRDEGDEAGAMASYLRAASARREFGIEDASVAGWLYEAARCADRLEEDDEAAELFGQAVALRRELFGSEHTLTLKAMIAQVRQARGLLVRLYEAWGRPDEADRWR